MNSFVPRRLLATVNLQSAQFKELTRTASICRTNDKEGRLGNSRLSSRGKFHAKLKIFSTAWSTDGEKKNKISVKEEKRNLTIDTIELVSHPPR